MKPYPLLAWTVTLLVTSAAAARADVSLDIRDTDADPHRTLVTTAQPTFTFDTLITITGHEQVAGMDFFLRSKDTAGQNVSNLFKITSRTYLVPGAEGQGDPDVALWDPLRAVLKPTTWWSLGFIILINPGTGVPPPLTGSPNETQAIARFTLQYLGPTAPPGTYWQIVLSNGSLDMGWNDPTGAAVFPFASQTNDLPGWQMAGRPYIVEYAPEPEGSLCVLVAAGFLGARARRGGR